MNLQQNLLQWFHKSQRPLPWRKQYRPYEVWISEIMLQQTQVETVLPYFKRWMKTLPTIASLAKCDEKRVLKLWEGLGYYSRARNLHKTSRLIMEKHGGKFPSDYDAILSLKGIGRYTAGAIVSIAFNQEKPIVDGNVLRVLSRVYAINKSIDVPKNREIFWRIQEKLIPKGRARYFNQALMELGALICTKDKPRCGACSINKFCAAYIRNEVEKYPVRAKRKRIVKVTASAVVLFKDGKFFIQRRPEGQIMGGLWEFPEWKLSRNKKIPLAKIKEKTAKLAKNALGLGMNGLRHLGSIKRNYTCHLESLHVFIREISSLSSPNTFIGDLSDSRQKHAGMTRYHWPFAWAAKKDFRRYPFSSAHAKIAQMLA